MLEVNTTQTWRVFQLNEWRGSATLPRFNIYRSNVCLRCTSILEIGGETLFNCRGAPGMQGSDWDIASQNSRLLRLDLGSTCGRRTPVRLFFALCGEGAMKWCGLHMHGPDAVRHLSHDW